MKETRPFVIKRDELAEINEIEVNGSVHYLGVHKDFRKNPFIGEFMPQSGRFAVSWVGLAAGHTLTAHTHPIASMIIITGGEAQLIGGIEQHLTEGDIVCVPPFASHGFVGAGESGFWGLSVQFTERGLYENEAAALVEFKAEDFKKALLQASQEWKDKFTENKLFKALQDEKMRRPFLRVMKNWSTHFQKLIMIRSAFEHNDEFLSISSEHLIDEFGHDNAFADVEDIEPSLELRAIFAWFSDQMLRMDDAQRLVAMHLAIEGSATIFYPKTKHLFAHVNESGHFEDHDEHDHRHEGLGFDDLRISDAKEAGRLRVVLEEHWAMIDKLMTQMMHDTLALSRDEILV